MMDKSLDLKIFESMPGAVVLFLPDAPKYTIVAVNSEFLKTFHLQKEMVTHKALSEVFPPGIKETALAGDLSLAASIRYVVSNKQSHQMPVQRYAVLNQYGTYTEQYRSSLNTPVPDEHGNVAYIIHSSEEAVEIQPDKTEQTNSRNFGYFFNQSNIPFAMLKGADFTFSFANAAYARLMNGRELVGKPLLEAVPELKDQPYTNILRKVLNEDSPVQLAEIPATVVFDDSGEPTTRYFNMTYAPYKNSEGINEGILAMGYDVTAQVELRKRKQDARLDYQAYNLFMQAPVPVCILKGPELIIELANDGALQIWGKEKKVIGKPLLEALPEIKDTAFPGLLQEVYLTGKTYQASESKAYFIRNGREELVYFNFVYQPYYEPNGSITGVLVVGNDITEQVYARKKVEESEKHFRSLVEEAPVATAVLTGDDFIVELVNDEMIRTSGKDGSITGKSFKDAFPEMADQPFYDLLKQVYTTGESYKATEGKVNLESDGTLQSYYFNFTFKALRNAEGVVYGVLIMAVDVTAQVKNRQRIEKSEASFRLLAGSMPQFVWTSDKWGNLNYFNEAVYKFLGLSFEELENDGWLQVIHPDEREENIRRWNESVNTGKDFLFHHRFQYKDGSYRWQLTRAVPLRDPEGNIELWVGTSTNIHEQKLFEEELQKRVKERTAELERSNRSLEEFAYVASHDLKEPIRKVHYFADRLKHSLKDRLSQEETNIFERMENSSERMRILVDDLLQYSHVSMGTHEMEEIDLREKLQKVIGDLELQVEEKAALINIGPMPVIKGYRRQIQQLFQNLIGNALKYHRPGEPPVINISSRALTLPDATLNIPQENLSGQYHLIEVSDNGIGFEQEQAERIFQIFTRLHGNKEFKGTGVGLSIARKVVENHGGYIWAESAAGKGASFKVLHPV